MWRQGIFLGSGESGRERDLRDTRDLKDSDVESYRPILSGTSLVSLVSLRSLSLLPGARLQVSFPAAGIKVTAVFLAIGFQSVLATMGRVCDDAKTHRKGVDVD
jgi:hypothetical protein